MALNDTLTSCGNPSRGRYVMGCRCFMCRVANADYAREHANGSEPSAMVGARETEWARRRIGIWRAQGIGLREIELWTGVPRSSLRTLVAGKHRNCNGLPSRMSRANYEAIMAASFFRKAIAPGALIDSAKTLRRMDGLHAKGMSYAEMARRSGLSRATVYKLERERPERITQRTATMMARIRRGNG